MMRLVSRTEPLSVAVATDTYAPAVNGVVRSVEASVAAFRKAGARVSVLAPGSRRVANEGERRFAGIETRLYPGLHLAVEPVRAKHLEGAQVLHVHTPGTLGLAALAAARRARVPAVFTYHTRFDHYARGAVRGERLQRLAVRATERLDRHVLRRVRAVVAPSETIARDVEDRFGVRADVVPTGVDLDRFRPAPRVGTQAPTFLHLGRISPEKNLDAVLRAFPRVRDALPGARLVVAGSGPGASRARHLAWTLGLEGSVEFRGYVPEDRLPAVYQDADVFVSASRFETQGLTVLEAMASGAACALADVDVFRPHRDASAARLFDPDEAGATADAMVAAYERRHALARAGLRQAAAHGTDACAKRLMRVFARAAAEG